MERVTSIDSGSNRAKNATSLAVVIVIFIIAFAIIGTTFVTISLNSWGHKLQDKGYVREEDGPYHGFYNKDGLRVRIGSGYLIFVESTDGNYDPSRSIKLINDMLNIDVSHMKTFLTNIVKSGSYQELETFTYNGNGYMYSLSVEYLNGSYEIEQTIDINTYESSNNLVMDNITIRLNDNADKIFDDIKELFMDNFNESDRYKYDYIFSKYYSGIIPLSDTYYSVKLGEYSMSGSYHDLTFYMYSSLSKTKEHDFYITYPKELFVEKYKDIINEDFKLLGINTNKEDVYSFIENIINGKDTYTDREFDLGDKTTIYINKMADKYEVSYNYRHINFSE